MALFWILKSQFSERPTNSNSSLTVNHLIQWIMGVNGVDKIGSKSNQNKASVPNTFRYVSYIAV